MADEYSVYAVYTKYALCIIVDIWSNVCTKFGTRSIRPVQDVWLTYNEVSDLYRTYGWRTQHIVRVHQVYLCIISDIRSNVCTKLGTRSIRPVPDVWLTYNEVYDLYRTYGWRTHHIVRVHEVYLCIIGDIRSNVCTKFGTRSIRPVQGVWITYNEAYDLHRTYGWRTKRIVRLHQV